MAKKVKAIVKLQIPAGKANPAPPVGTALGPHGVNIMGFCKEYNARTQSQMGQVVPVEITIFQDQSFTFITKTPPAAELIKKAAGIDKGSGVPNTEKAGEITNQQVREIAEIKLKDLDNIPIDSAMQMVKGHGPQHGSDGCRIGGICTSICDPAKITESSMGGVPACAPLAPLGV